MNYFETYSSMSIGAGANQLYFDSEEGRKITGLAFFKIAVSGKYTYSLLFSDVLDSTYADGSKGFANLKLGGYKIHRISVGRCKEFPFSSVKDAKPWESLIENETVLTFEGNQEKIVDGPVYTDGKELYFDKGDYIAVKITFSGKKIPYHPESILPIYKKTDTGYEYSVNMPLPLMIGAKRAVRERIGYLGDSITQGIGTEFNAYRHWCALLSEMIGTEYSHYNLGIGYARASDAATDGPWLARAKTCDTVFLCLGTNDVAHDKGGAESIIESLNTIICKLKAANCRIILQTEPPFDRVGERKIVWFETNELIKERLSGKVDLLFDNVPILGLSEEEPERSKYNGHPNAEGCRVWAEALYEATRYLFKGEKND